MRRDLEYARESRYTEEEMVVVPHEGQRGLRRSFLVIAALAVATCEGLDTLGIQESSSATIPHGTLLEQLAGDIGFDGFLSFDISQNETIRNQGVTRNQIDSVRITSITLSITDGVPDFTFLDELTFYAEAPGLERKRIARGGPFEEGAATVELEIDDVELADYAAAEAMDITTEASGRRPDDDTTIDAVVELTVDVNVEGVVCGG